MNWRDALALAARNVIRRPGRAVLTVLAVGLAATLFTALLTISRTAETRVLGQLASGGPLAGIKVVAAEPDPGELSNDNAKPGPPKRLDDSAIRSIEAIPGVKSVTRVITNDSVVVSPVALPNGQAVQTQEGRSSFRNGALFQQVVGVDLNQAKQLPITVLAGRLPAPGSVDEVAVTPAYVVKLGIARTAESTVVGSEVQIGAPRAFADNRRTPILGQWTRALVVGVVAQDTAPGQLVVSLQEAQAARAWTMAGTDAGGEITVPTSPYDGLFVVSRELSQVDSVRNAITQVGYSTSAPENLIASVERYMQVVKIVLGGIGVIALIISALGITNAMLAAVRERRREIGVLKAIGARDRDVGLVFVTEAAVLGAIGGIIGTIAGLAIAKTVGTVVNGYLTGQGLPGVKATLPVGLLAVAIVGSTLVALVAGVLPAIRAARLPAREAVEA